MTKESMSSTNSLPLLTIRQQNQTYRQMPEEPMPKATLHPAASHAAPRDAVDRQLIALLQANARDSTANLARKLAVARTTVSWIELNNLSLSDPSEKLKPND